MNLNSNISIKLILSILLVSFLGLQSQVQAQIYAPEGLNMPGSWNDWTNPPSNLIFAGNSQTPGGKVLLVPTSNPVYQTSFHVSNNGDIVAGDYSFKFTSGPLDNIWQNQWGSVNVNINEIDEYTYGVDGTNAPDDNNITLQNNSWYILNWNNIGYENTSAIFMEIASEPVDLIALTQEPIMPTATDEVEISIEASASPSADEYIYIRYTTDNWINTQLVECNFVGPNGTALIPSFLDNTEINYYAFSTIIDNPTENIDLTTINYNNNLGSNYSYTVGDTLSCGTGIALITTEPPFPLESSEVVITFNADLGNGGLSGYNDTVYAHTGVITSESTGNSDWKYVKSEWGENTPDTKLTLIDSNLYEL